MVKQAIFLFITALLSWGGYTWFEVLIKDGHYKTEKQKKLFWVFRILFGAITVAIGWVFIIKYAPHIRRLIFHSKWEI